MVLVDTERLVQHRYVSWMRLCALHILSLVNCMYVWLEQYRYSYWLWVVRAERLMQYTVSDAVYECGDNVAAHAGNEWGILRYTMKGVDDPFQFPDAFEIYWKVFFCLFNDFSDCWMATNWNIFKRLRKYNIVYFKSLLHGLMYGYFYFLRLFFCFCRVLLF